MTVESGPKYIAPEQKFSHEVVPRFDLWRSIIDESAVDDSLKSEINDCLIKFLDNGLKSWRSLDDAFYWTISRMVTITESWREKDTEVAALFESLRDDLWDFHKEITKH